MSMPASIQTAIDSLAREPLRNVVLLKHLMAYREHVKVHRAFGPEGVATLVELDASVSPFDRETYPKAAVAALISSDHPTLTAALMPHVSRGVGVVFKLSREADLAPVKANFPVHRRTAFVSFTASAAVEPDSNVQVTSAPSDAAFGLLETQGHQRTWLRPLLAGGKAFACVLEREGQLLSACCAFEIYQQIWEVGGVITDHRHRRSGFGKRLVRTAIAALLKRGLTPRYQVDENNEASIALARSVGLSPFLTITHYAHAC